jgi:N-acylneuraminate cytidylyltransferase
LINQIENFKENNIVCDALILLQPTNPFRNNEILWQVIEKFQNSGRNSIATFSNFRKKFGNILNDKFVPQNYIPGQRSQDIPKSYYENGLLYISKTESILKGKIITDDVFPFLCEDVESSVDIDNLEDFIFAESILKLKNYE